MTNPEALVLFEWLARFSESGDCSFQDKAEQTVLWRLEGCFETQLVEPFKSDYRELLAAAWDQIKGPDGDQ